MFCRECGVTMINPIMIKAGTEFNPGEAPYPIFGVFPGAFTSKMSEMAQEFQPTGHANCALSNVDTSRIHDGLPKYAHTFGQELLHS
jgi:hypothetical protein